MIKERLISLFQKYVDKPKMNPAYSANSEPVCIEIQAHGEHKYSVLLQAPFETNFVFLGYDENGHEIYRYDVVQRARCKCGAEALLIVSEENVKYV